jgi:hypothetical protein
VRGGDAFADAARRAAHGVLGEATAQARAEAVEILKRRMVEAILDEVAGSEETATKPAPEHGVYVYGFTRGHPERVEGLVGVEGSTTYPVTQGDLVAVVSDVSGSPGGWGIDAGGQPDLELLAPLVTSHERLLEDLLERGTVLPMRFGTLFPSPSAVAEVLRLHGGAIAEGLAALDGKVEWGLTVTCAPELPAPPAEKVAGTPGRAYLGRRGQEEALEARRLEQGAVLAHDLHRAIGATAAASVAHPLPREDADGRRVLLKASYLVERAARERFEAAIVAALEGVAGPALAGDLTGPWPPYNFTDLRLEGAGV